ncbi:ABC transporter substrate-binding protein [Zafaria cholistanensis]|uniref:ABC transporter substrate-binding protein n=1 Tax=Zafaria cholistanensis TaxID=1682741 RepID=A0A5A7NR08_9MICC|nr:tripartite tricarboxylate transporter substrate binding protein [Zafaria cholistanensis]GER23293.1 ABC transporter substrate-binding protein [Zafaria cholistanensis]
MKKIQTIGAGSRRGLAAAAGVAALLALTGCGGVQGGDKAEDPSKYPSRAIELTVPYDPGGSTDLIARALAQGLDEPLGEPVVVANKPGGGGVLGAREVLGTSGNGYSIVTLSQSQFSISPLVESDSNLLDLEEMRVLAGLTTEEYALVVPADSPYASLQDLLTADKVSFSHSGVGTGTHYALEVLFKDAEVQANGVPFDGSNPSLTALLGGQVDVSAGNIAEVMPQIKAGKIKPLATFSAERSEFLPDVPTATEAGYDIVLDQRRFIAAPAGLSDEVADKLQTAIGEAESQQAYKDFLEKNYIAYWGADPEATKQQLKEATEAIATKTQELGIDFGQNG